jgi:hypothetical protein
MGVYQRNMILVTYRAEHPDNLKPTEGILDVYDADLAEEYDEEIKSQAAEKGITPNKFNRSMLVFFANQSDAASVPKRVEQACTYFLAVKPTP